MSFSAFFWCFDKGKKKRKKKKNGAAGAAQRRVAPPQAAAQVRGYKCLIQECPFAPYFEFASGVDRFRGPGGCVAGAWRPQGHGFSATRSLSTLLDHISLRYDELSSHIDRFTLQFATAAREGRTFCATRFASLIKKQGSPQAGLRLDGHLDFTFLTLVRLV